MDFVVGWKFYYSHLIVIYQNYLDLVWQMVLLNYIIQESQTRAANTNLKIKKTDLFLAYISLLLSCVFKDY